MMATSAESSMTRAAGWAGRLASKGFSLGMVMGLGDGGESSVMVISPCTTRLSPVSISSGSGSEMGDS